jgi:hypothetical protein
MFYYLATTTVVAKKKRVRKGDYQRLNMWGQAGINIDDQEDNGTTDMHIAVR